LEAKSTSLIGPVAIEIRGYHGGAENLEGWGLG